MVSKRERLDLSIMAVSDVPIMNQAVVIGYADLPKGGTNERDA